MVVRVIIEAALVGLAEVVVLILLAALRGSIDVKGGQAAFHGFLAAICTVEQAIGVSHSVISLSVNDLENRFNNALLQILIVLSRLLGDEVVVAGLWVEIPHSWIEALGVGVQLTLVIFALVIALVVVGKYLLLLVCLRRHL